MIGVVQVLAGGAMCVTCFCLVAQAVIVRGRFGWKYRPWWNRGLMVSVAVFLFARALTVLHGGVALNPLGLGVSFSMALWQFAELARVITESWREREAALELRREVEATPLAPLPPYGWSKPRT